jgi:trimeric autotransporter adhesin
LALAIEFTDSSFANTAVGRGAMIGTLGNTTNLAYNTVAGYYAGAQMDSVEFVTAIGTQAGYYNRGRENTFLGFNSGAGFSGTDLTGIENTGLGTATLTFNNTGRTNTAVGMGAMFGNRTGSNNTAVGVRSMLNGQTGSNNVTVGDSTLVNNTASDITAIGHWALRNNSTGTSNVAVGSQALVNNTTGGEK